MIQNMM